MPPARIPLDFLVPRGLRKTAEYAARARELTDCLAKHNYAILSLPVDQRAAVNGKVVALHWAGPGVGWGGCARYAFECPSGPEGAGPDDKRMPQRAGGGGTTSDKPLAHCGRVRSTLFRLMGLISEL